MRQLQTILCILYIELQSALMPLKSGWTFLLTLRFFQEKQFKTTLVIFTFLEIQKENLITVETVEISSAVKDQVEKET